MHNYAILKTQKRQRTCIPDHVCWKNWYIRQTHTHTNTHTHMPFSTFQNTYYTTWLSWTLTHVKCYWECKGWTNICNSWLPGVCSWFWRRNILSSPAYDEWLYFATTSHICCLLSAYTTHFQNWVSFRIFCMELYA